MRSKCFLSCVSYPSLYAWWAASSPLRFRAMAPELLYISQYANDPGPSNLAISMVPSAESIRESTATSCSARIWHNISHVETCQTLILPFREPENRYLPSLLTIIDVTPASCWDYLVSYSWEMTSHSWIVPSSPPVTTVASPWSTKIYLIGFWCISLIDATTALLSFVETTFTPVLSWSLMTSLVPHGKT